MDNVFIPQPPAAVLQLRFFRNTDSTTIRKNKIRTNSVAGKKNSMTMSKTWLKLIGKRGNFSSCVPEQIQKLDYWLRFLKGKTQDVLPPKI
jgi:hypothetical protein